MKVRQTAPSNIALIKYMGKTDTSGNLPANTSLSYTLPQLVTTVELEALPEGRADQWEPLKGAEFFPLELSSAGQERFLAHFALLKKELQIDGSYTVRSGNNFPSDCGLASSASSFAALTKAAFSLVHEPPFSQELLFAMSEVSRRGSGSSCRSFFGPWCLWQKEAAEPLSLGGPLENLEHMVVVAEGGVKKISSSQAHRGVLTSSLFEGRISRAHLRLDQLTRSLKENQWQKAFEIVWAEFWDMHALFETSAPPFGYMSAGSQEILNWTRQQWEERGDGPLVTMDAGPNVHFLYRKDQKELFEFYKDHFSKKWEVLGSFKP